MKISSVEFHNYKAFKHYSLTLQAMNVLVGPNNCGKSTIIDAFKILSVALRKARAKKPDAIPGLHGRAYGYELSTDVVAVSLENAHTDYSEADTTITFRLTNGNRLQLYFPKDGGCRLLPLSVGKAVTTVAAFKTEYPVTVAVVPVLGRVEHEEVVVQKETVQRNLETENARDSVESSNSRVTHSTTPFSA
jgi:energy-coupling factor transporter ATP-binding protein EcfA2